MKSAKSERREAQRRKRIHGMRVSGRSVKLLAQLPAKPRKPSKR